jgi:hypothetical protein
MNYKYSFCDFKIQINIILYLKLNKTRNEA